MTRVRVAADQLRISVTTVRGARRAEDPLLRSERQRLNQVTELTT